MAVLCERIVLDSSGKDWMFLGCRTAFGSVRADSQSTVHEDLSRALGQLLTIVEHLPAAEEQRQSHRIADPLGFDNVCANDQEGRGYVDPIDIGRREKRPGLDALDGRHHGDHAVADP